MSPPPPAPLLPDQANQSFSRLPSSPPTRPRVPLLLGQTPHANWPKQLGIPASTIAIFSTTGDLVTMPILHPKTASPEPVVLLHPVPATPPPPKSRPSPTIFPFSPSPPPLEPRQPTSQTPPPGLPSRYFYIPNTSVHSSTTRDPRTEMRPWYTKTGQSEVFPTPKSPLPFAHATQNPGPTSNIP